MLVNKRNATSEPFDGNKIRIFLTNIVQYQPQLKHVNLDRILPLQGLPTQPTTVEIATHVAESCAEHTVSHVEYGQLAGRAATAAMLKTCANTLLEATNTLEGILDPSHVSFVRNNAEELNSYIVKERNYNFDIFGISTLRRSYLLRSGEERNVVETPQHLFMRVAIALHRPDLDRIRESYDLFSTHCISHATPTLFNSGLKRQQLASCFLTDMGDSMESIYETMKDMALISKNAGGIGLNTSRIRGDGALIKGVGNGVSQGIVPMLKVVESTMLYVDQGSKRKGSCASFLKMHHPDIMDWLMLRRNDAAPEARRARGLFFGLFVSDLFMERVKEGKDWSLFQPNEVSELEDAFGGNYQKIYEQAEKDGKAVATIPARKLMDRILESQIETGTPYILYADTINKRNMQTGVIRQSNLCVEIVQHTSSTETSVCTLASICLPKCIDDNEFNFIKLRELVNVAIRNLNQTIDRSYYPIQKAKYSHKKRRPVGLGCQGLADSFQSLGLIYGSPEALALDRKIFETMYLQALTTSNTIAKERNEYYQTFPESKAANGVFQFDLVDGVELSYPEEWEALRGEVKQHGLYNSLVLALMPTASSASIYSNSESFEPRSSNAYIRRTLGGEHVVVNPLLFKGREWDETMANQLLADRGSVQNIDSFSDREKKLFRHVFEISMREHIDHAAARQPFIDQSQSMSLHFKTPTKRKLMSALFYGHSKGLKTGMYYLRRLTEGKTMGTLVGEQKTKKKMECKDDVCEMCSS